MLNVRDVDRYTLMLRQTAGLDVIDAKRGGIIGCAGLPSMLAAEDEWLCDFCMSH